VVEGGGLAFAVGEERDERGRVEFLRGRRAVGLAGDARRPGFVPAARGGIALGPHLSLGGLKAGQLLHRGVVGRRRIDFGRGAADDRHLGFS
jgi:hypothetical protein